MLGRRAVALAFWAAVAVALAMLPVDGRTLLQGRDLSDALVWAESAPPAMVVAALARAAAVVGALYLSLAALMLFVAALVPCAGIVAQLVPRGTARLLGAMVGVAAVVSVPTATAAEESDTPSRTARMQPVVATEVVIEPSPPTATMSWVEPEPALTPGSTALPIAEHPAAVRTWEVRCGQHFWSIAAATLEQRADGVGLEQHWRELIELNRAQLPDPSNPDLILPGMLLTLP